MNTYSVIILTKNEESIIGTCIESLPNNIPCFVLDSGSTDNTKDVVIASGALYYENKIQPFIISEQRNWALKNLPIETEWVLFLDADEYIPEDLHLEILNKIQSNEFDAYRMTPKFMFWGKWMKRIQGYPNWHDRLLKKDKVSIIGGVWEKFDDKANVGLIKIPYEHYANIKGFESWLEKHDRYSSWDAQKTFDYLYKGTNIGAVRKKKLRTISAKLWWLRPWARCFYMYFIRLGFLEGWRAFYFTMLYFLYEYMIVFKIIELKRKYKGKSI